LRYAATYLLLRYALFDQICNRAAKEPMDYEGGLNYYDKTIRRIPPTLVYASKVISFGMVIYINK
jgi:hypothetical protein